MKNSIIVAALVGAICTPNQVEDSVTGNPSLTRFVTDCSYESKHRNKKRKNKRKSK